MTSITENQTIFDILNWANILGYGAPTPKPDDTHRYYLCEKVEGKQVCARVKYEEGRANMDPAHTLRWIKRGCPEMFDTTTLSYKAGERIHIVPKLASPKIE